MDQATANLAPEAASDRINAAIRSQSATIISPVRVASSVNSDVLYPGFFTRCLAVMRNADPRC